MAKKKEKAAAKEETVQAIEGELEDEEVADDNSPEAYTLTGDYRADYNEICKRSEMEPVLLRQRAQNPASLGTETAEGAPTTFTTKDKYEYLRPCIEVEQDEENKDSIKSFYVKGWKVSPSILNVLNLAAPQTLTTISFWRCGLDREALHIIANMLSKLAVRNVSLDGNPECSGHFHLLLAEECTISSLSLRSNKISCSDITPLAAALSTNKSLTNLSLHNNCIEDEGAMQIARGLRMNRTLLTLNLSGNKITDVGTKALSDILTSLTLTHEEVVARRKLISENKSSLVTDEGRSGSGLSVNRLNRIESTPSFGSPTYHDKYSRSVSHKPPTTPGGRAKDRPGSNSRTGSHTALDKKGKGASGKGNKKQDKMEKPGTKDGRKSDMGNKGKDDKRKGSRAGGGDAKKGNIKKGTAGKKYQEEKEQEPEVVEFSNPLLEANMSEKEGKIVVPGNYALTCLNLNNNSINDNGITSLYKAIHFQENSSMKRGIKGLLRLTLRNNKFDVESRHYNELVDMMTRRDPFYEQPLIEEDQSNITAQT
ncbi:hypothetical protein ACHWQZ_G012927 [Mnemiopsis leidyi]